jgi:hypothetical protein
VETLAREVVQSLIAKHSRQELLNAFFQHTRLELRDEPCMGSKINKSRF